MKAVTSNPFPAAYSDKVRQVGAITTKNKILTTIAAALDGPKVLRDYLIENYLMEDFTLDEVCKDDDRAEASSAGPPSVCGTRPVPADGRRDDPMAVTDNQAGAGFRPKGGRRLDFPVVPCANTNFPTIMTAEKIADDLLGAELRLAAPGPLFIAMDARELTCAKFQNPETQVTAQGGDTRGDCRLRWLKDRMGDQGSDL